MKKNKFLIIAALLLALFFSLQFFSEMFFAWGKNLDAKSKLKKYQLGLAFFPLSSSPFRATAFLNLEEGIRNKNSVVVKESIRYFQKALRMNPLDYQAHYFLAKAYLQFSSTSSDYFELAVDELKRAARIRGNNKDIALDCGMVFFSLWPLLEEEDKTFAASLLSNAMPSFSWSEFSPLLEMWSFYVQDTPLLMALLNQKPDFFGPSADQLVAAGIPLARRWNLLNLYEIYTLDAVERRYNEMNMKGLVSNDEERSLFYQLQSIKGYYRLQPKSDFRLEKMVALKRTLLLALISGLLDDQNPQSSVKTAEYINAYLIDFADLADIGALQKMLQEKNYFKTNDFPSLRLKTLINYRLGNYGDIIAEIEALRQTISFVKKEQLADYTAILLLLVDSYYSSKLLTAGESVARELYQNQPENPEVLYRVLRIQNILGAEGAVDKTLNNKLAVIANSRLLTISMLKSVSDVFLFNQPEIEIVIDPALRLQLKPRQLLQVFVDDKIAYESYVDGLPEKIVIGPPFTQPECKVKVQVSVL
jgi:hypothetical protein